MTEKTSDPDPYREHFRALGQKGGRAYAKKVPKAARKQIARMGGQASIRALRARLKAKAKQEPSHE
jgi:general stress protein YciG